MKPVLFVAGHVPAYRVGALARLHEREGIEVALFGGSSLHGGPAAAGRLPFPSRSIGPAGLARAAAGGRYRAVVCPTAGRLAPLATWAGARAGRIPLILWASLWAHPRTPAHLFTYLPLARLYRSADAVVTYGSHVSRYVSGRGAHNVHIAPQSVDNDFWSAPAADAAPAGAWAASSRLRYLFVGRPAPEKGLDVLLAAWRSAALPPHSALALVGVGRDFADLHGEGSGRAEKERVVCLDPVGREQLRDIYASAHVLVLPSIPTPRFREPWGLVVNEAMNRGLAVLATDAVGAAAGGLVRDGDTGLVVPAGDAGRLAAAMERLGSDAALRSALGAAGARAVAGYTYDAWAEGFSSALATVGLSRAHW
jgi:glycosyltransferase involved in cell wall biosynthesis